MNWIAQLRTAAERVDRAPPMSAAKQLQTGKLTERLAVCVDHETQVRLEAEAQRVGVHRADLLRSYIARGLNQWA